jgi:hypothetical protein
MKNIQVIEPANNCAYDIFSCSDDDFIILFGVDNVQFIEELSQKINNKKLDEILNRIWKNPIEKHKINGINGTLFFGFYEIKKKFYPDNRESNLNYKGRGWEYID